MPSAGALCPGDRIMSKTNEDSAFVKLSYICVCVCVCVYNILVLGNHFIQKWLPNTSIHLSISVYIYLFYVPYILLSIQ